MDTAFALCGRGARTRPNHGGVGVLVVPGVGVEKLVGR